MSRECLLYGLAKWDETLYLNEESKEQLWLQSSWAPIITEWDIHSDGVVCDSERLAEEVGDQSID